MLLLNFIFFAVSIIALILAGSFTVKYLSKIAAFLHASEYVLGFMLMAIATSIPELFVGISSAIAKQTALSMGNVIGSNIANVTIIIGISILLAKGMHIKSEKTRKDSIYMTLIVVVPIILTLIGGTLSRIDGVILLGFFGIYSYNLWKQSKEFKKELEDSIPRWQIVLDVFLFIISVIALFLSSNFVVKYASNLAVDLSLPPIVIGLLLIAIGTSLPELVFGTHAILKGHTEMALGNIIGSGVANATLVLGATSIIYPITADFLLFISSGVFMIVVCFLFSTFVETGRRLSTMEGISMVLLYVFFIIVEYYLKGIRLGL